MNALCLMLVPVVHGEKYASDAGLVGSRLRLGYFSGWWNFQRPMVFFLKLLFAVSFNRFIISTLPYSRDCRRFANSMFSSFLGAPASSNIQSLNIYAPPGIQGVQSARGCSMRPRLPKAPEAAQSTRGYSKRPRLPKAPEAAQSVRGLSKRLRLLKAHCVLGPELYSCTWPHLVPLRLSAAIPTFTMSRIPG